MAAGVVAVSLRERFIELWGTQQPQEVTFDGRPVQFMGRPVIYNVTQTKNVRKPNQQGVFDPGDEPWISVGTTVGPGERLGIDEARLKTISLAVDIAVPKGEGDERLRQMETRALFLMQGLEVGQGDHFIDSLQDPERVEEPWYRRNLIGQYGLVDAG